ncbi:MAG: pantoate--beta-alanine ligase [Lewinellaceae bacterium]|nr:pantoate--beta-alanine ligase [Lewinellaceae bacterium]
MFLSKHVDALQEWLAQQKEGHQTIGFAPTMGALHDGHLELVRMAKRAGDLAVVSIFVNPTQFNDTSDLEKYPRTPGRDLELLLSADCDAVFMPPVEEVYPPGADLSISLNFGEMENVMEGEFRPGHFSGMATVVNRLLDIVKPDRLYMGQKDFQQLSIVRDMIRQLKLPAELVMCPTVREADGLAMSSRNIRLTPAMRALAPILHQTLLETGEQLQRYPARELEANAMARLEAAGFRPEYFSMVDGRTLQPVDGFDSSDFIVACTAAWAGDVRLIDNVVLKGQAG